MAVQRWCVLVLLLAVAWDPRVVEAVVPLQATVTVIATDPNGYALSYHWKVTGGAIVDQNAATTTWTLPDGPGIHFAYVMVANGHGGYTERRIAVSTDGIGNPVTAPAPVVLDAPAAPAASGEMLKGRLNGFTWLSNGAVVDLTDIPVMLRDLSTGQVYPPQTCSSPPCTVKTDLRGEYIFSNVVPGNLQILCAYDRGTALGACDTVQVGSGYARWPRYASLEFTGSWFTAPDIVGSAVGSDGTPCGVVSRFFAGVAGNTSLGEAGATASLHNSANALLQGPVRLDAYGAYEFLGNSSAATVQINCEGASLTVPVPSAVATAGGQVAASVFPNVAQPVVSSMTATLTNGSVFNGPFLPSGTGTLPSDQQYAPNKFLSYLGLDTKLGACQYYRAIGAVQGCDAQGNFINPISFSDWKLSEQMSPNLLAGATEHTANYVNKVDLNLTRRHHLVSYGSNQTAGYVCNHLGPKVSKVGLDAAQADVDAAIQAALAGNNLIACVAMDYRVHPGANGNQPFVRFLIFAPDGRLLPSINLDFEDEKYVPGVCVACHGGDHYIGPYPEDGTGRADIGAHFLPFDSGNFAYSSATNLTEQAQQDEIYRMNQIVANATGATIAAKELVTGWYASGSSKLDKAWIAPGWQDSTNNKAYYKNVYSRHCRTCHVNMSDDFPVANLIVHFAHTMCGGYRGRWRNHTMPNSMVTFNRFWLGGGSGPDQITPTEFWFNDGSQLVNHSNCYLTTLP